MPVSTRWSAPPSVAALCALLASCGGSPTDGGSGGGFAVPPPSAVPLARAIEPDALSVRVTLDGEPLEVVREGGTWRVDAVLAPGAGATLEIAWTERVDERDLPLASLTREVGPLESDGRLAIGADEYVTSGEGLDADGDGTSNLAERVAGTNPFGEGGSGEPVGTPPDPSPGSPGTSATRPEAIILPFDPERFGTPVIDGRFDVGIWDRAATFSDRDGELLRINRLVIDADARADDGDPGISYIWFAMHDFTYLYLFVQFERNDPPFTAFEQAEIEREGDPFTPWRDSGPRFFEDDAVNVFFDGDASATAELDGVTGDDRYFAVPLLAEGGEGLPSVFAGRPELAPEIPPSLGESGLGVCLPACNVTGWEMRIALADLGIVVDRPFGFEVQLDQDHDGGGRESRWAWAYPSITDRDGPFVAESPALFGRVTLASSRP